MALRSLNHWRNMMNRLKGSESYATSTTPKMKAFNASAVDHPDTKPRLVKGEFVPVCVAMGAICLQLGFGMHAVMQQVRCPNVFLKKKRRETVPELEEPEHVLKDAENFVNKSFFRKVAHVQDFDGQEVMRDPIRGDTYSSERRNMRTLTLKDVGVDPKLH